MNMPKPITGNGSVNIRAIGKKFGFKFDVTKEIPLEFINGKVKSAMISVPEMKGQVLIIDGRIEGEESPEGLKITDDPADSPLSFT